MSFLFMEAFFFASVLFLPMRGYEPDSIDNIDKPLVLFLPMRGYERLRMRTLAGLYNCYFSP